MSHSRSTDSYSIFTLEGRQRMHSESEDMTAWFQNLNLRLKEFLTIAWSEPSSCRTWIQQWPFPVRVESQCALSRHQETSFSADHHKLMSEARKSLALDFSQAAIYLIQKIVRMSFVSSDSITIGVALSGSVCVAFVFSFLSLAFSCALSPLLTLSFPVFISLHTLKYTHRLSLSPLPSPPPNLFRSCSRSCSRSSSRSRFLFYTISFPLSPFLFLTHCRSLLNSLSLSRSLSLSSSLSPFLSLSHSYCLSFSLSVYVSLSQVLLLSLRLSLSHSISLYLSLSRSISLTHTHAHTHTHTRTRNIRACTHAHAHALTL